jgi:hypothetical protein
MQQFFRDNHAYWGGLHRELGLLIYDPRDQQRLAADKVRLYVAAEHRRATFIKAIVQTGLIPSRLETWWCPQHAVVMQQHHNARGTWWSHPVADGTWCTGQAKATSTATPVQPCTTPTEGDVHEPV